MTIQFPYYVYGPIVKITLQWYFVIVKMIAVLLNCRQIKHLSRRALDRLVAAYRGS